MALFSNPEIRIGKDGRIKSPKTIEGNSSTVIDESNISVTIKDSDINLLRLIISILRHQEQEGLR